jgi:cytochrome c peroxidase
MNPRRKSRARALALAGVVSLGLSAAATTVRADGLPAATNLAALKQKYRRPAAIPFPADNPYSDAKAELGQTLFFDPRLSGAGTMSCGTCHNPALTWKDGLPRGVGHDAKQLGRATPTILNLAWADLLMWDGRKNGLEDQATGPIGSPAEMNQPLEQLVPKLSGATGYHSAFAKAFGSDEITVPKIAQAIATFERTVVSNKSPFDLWIEGNEMAISDGAKRGFQLFNTKANCAACHSGWRFTDDGFHDIGLPSEDPGRAAQVPDEPTLQHAFKTPTLRNISARAPYMHDGSVATLDAVLVHYASGFVSRPSLSPEMHRLGLTAAERADLLAFLQSLTSKDDLITMPQLPVREVSQ